jgi:signal transduction histidine kinase/HAMP domain-containing protein
MKLTLRTRLTISTAALVLAVVAAVSVAYLAALTKQVIRQAQNRAIFVAQEMFLEAQQALGEAASRGRGPESTSTADMQKFVQQTLRADPGWNAAVQASMGYSASVYEITVSDADRTALVSSDASLPGRQVYRRPDVGPLVRSGFFSQLAVLYGPPRVYEYVLPFNLGARPFGEVRVAISTALLRNEISPGLKEAGLFAAAAVLISTLVAFVLSRATLAPVQKISEQLDRITAGESDVEPVLRKGEFGQVSTKISRIGRELHDVREVFSTLRENLNQIMAHLEDGVLLFSADGRIVLASPSVSQFLNIPANELTGKRAQDVFAEEHPLREIPVTGDAANEEIEVLLQTGQGEQRVGVRTQPVTEGGSRMGTLMTLRDLESRERIGNELQVSEHLAIIGRVTAGVAHEVKNPLNSMRVWLEVLKSSLPTEAEPQQAAQMLDSEIERLDRVVKTFLDFTRPVQLQMEDVDLRAMLEEVLESTRPAAAGVETSMDLETGVPPVRGDRALLRQAVLNLVLNACQAMGKGGKLSVQLHRRDEMAEVLISDTGKGIASQHRNKIFQLYFTTRPGGSGVGLANAFRFVQLHGGSIEFESELGRGTSFRVRLPFAVDVHESAQTRAGETMRTDTRLA